MKRFFPVYFAIVFTGCISLSGAEPKTSPAVTASASVHFDDPAGLLPLDPAWIHGWDAKLAEFERATGLRVFVQFHLKSPSAKEDKKPGIYMHALAEKLGTVRKGVLVVYFADEDDWRVWIGDDTTPLFVGQPGTAKEFTKSGKMHEVKEAFLASAHAKGETAFSDAKHSAPADHAPGATSSALRLKFLTEALLGDLISKLGSKK